MTNHNFIKIFALISVVAFISVCAVVYFVPMSSRDFQNYTSTTYSDFETTSSDAYTTSTSESTTEYYDENGSLKYVLKTSIDFHSTIIDDNLVRSYCKCTAQYNNQTVTHIFQNDITVVNSHLTEEFVTNTISEPVKKCSDECIKFGASQFFGMK